MITRFLALLVAADISSCETTTHPTVDPASAPSRQVVPMDLSLYSENELRIFAARCDSEVANALAHNETTSAQGWAQVRSEVQFAIDRKHTPVEAAPRVRHVEVEVPPSWYQTHHKVWNADHTRWHYEPNANASPTPEQLPELIKRYRQLNSP
jgi:hypothetical protein